MKAEQLSSRIGNIDDKLIEESEKMTNFRSWRYTKNIRRSASVAAVLVLMVSSFIAGAFALAREPEVIYVEKEQEMIEVGDSGISLILPNSWNGKYAYSYEPINRFNSYLEVNHPATGALLFWIERSERQFTMDTPFPERGFTIAITENYTYIFCKPWWDVTDTNNINNPWLHRQVSSSRLNGKTGINDPIAWAEYDEMCAAGDKIDVVMTTEMLANSINATNWVPGTVVISIWENGEMVQNAVCDEEQSRIIREIIGSRDYHDNGPVSPPHDITEQSKQMLDALNRGPSIYITFDGEDYRLVTSTGNTYKLQRIMNGNYLIYGGDLSTEEVRTITDLLSDFPS